MAEQELQIMRAEEEAQALREETLLLQRPVPEVLESTLEISLAQTLETTDGLAAEAEEARAQPDSNLLAQPDKLACRTQAAEEAALATTIRILAYQPAEARVL
jgi:hypothetical protein